MSALQTRKFWFAQVHSCRNWPWAYVSKHCSAVVLSVPGVVYCLLCGAVLHIEIITSPHFLSINNIPAKVTTKYSSCQYKVISSGITASSSGSHQNSPHPYCHFVLPLTLYFASRRGGGRQEPLGRWVDDQATLKVACFLHLFRFLHQVLPYLKLQFDTAIFKLV